MLVFTLYFIVIKKLPQGCAVRGYGGHAFNGYEASRMLVIQQGLKRTLASLTKFQYVIH